LKSYKEGGIKNETKNRKKEKQQMIQIRAKLRRIINYWMNDFKRIY